MDSRQVFISYSRRDEKGSEFAKELKQRIDDTTELRAFLDEFSLQKGKPWSRGLDKAIEDSFAIIVVTASKANSSTWVTYEWAYAMGLSKPIVALKIEENPEPSIHDKLETYQNFEEKFISPTEENWQGLLDELENLYQEIQIPPMVQQAKEFAEHPLPEYRKQAIESLKQNEHPSSTQALIELLESYLPDTRQQAAFALASKTKDEQAIPELKQALLPPTTRDKAANASALLRHIDTEYSARTLYEAYIEHHDSDLRSIIIGAFRSTQNPSAISYIRDCYRHKKGRLPVSRVELLRKLADSNDIAAIEDFENFIFKDYNIENQYNIRLALIRTWTQNYPAEQITDFYINIVEHEIGNPTKLSDAALERLRKLGKHKIAEELVTLTNYIASKTVVDGAYINDAMQKIRQSLDE